MLLTTSSHRLSYITAPNFTKQGNNPLATPSANHIRNSAGSCTESFHLYSSSSTATLKIPTCGFIPSVALVSFALLPLFQGGITPLLPCWSAKKKSESLPVSNLSGNPFGINRDTGLCLRISASH